MQVVQSDEVKQAIRSQALEAGFQAVGFGPAAMGEREQGRLQAFVDSGQNGDMAWMGDHLDRRRSPKGLWPDVRSVIVLAMNYGPEEDPMAMLEQPDLANISCYARNRDYHDLIKKRLKQVARWIVGQYGGDVKVFVDTAPVMEKPLAALSGVGWQGKHTNLVSRDYGSWLFLGEIYTTLDLVADEAQGDHCGGCRRCLDICPTQAFPAPYTLDATRCISYLTIEHKGPIPVEFRKAMGNRIYGCDDCLAVCPWNKFATPSQETWFLPRETVQGATLATYLGLDDATFRACFSGSPVKRIGRDRFLRNVLIAAGNSGNDTLVPAVIGLLADPNPIVRGAAVWALSQLSTTEFQRLKSERMEPETDPDVLAEWAIE
ncbi:MULTISPECIES: tRNA epoxyqueuosine(34) reductase QueG [unclassified Hwanghaeella]|jgi:epoxyqueuosine reductase|uniref:tRNA epoxyqueuosine(34) reductase QueG n=1 Tax=unclassified Hwanghaeella TaxID=2605944 RepID=UPI003B670965|tara:strand:+ start:10785 stop:11909 length:1125 start_codon:yes stop_codon:yes gene_type:complete